MLEFIRERAQGWLTWFIVGIIIIAFGAFGISSYFEAGPSSTVAEVNGAPISQAQFQRAYFQERQRLQELLGSNFRPELFPEERIRQQVLQELVRQELIVQAALKGGMRVSDAQLAGFVRGIDAFHVDGQFSGDRYREILARQGMQPAFFEAGLKRDLVAQQFVRGVAETDFSTHDAVGRYLALERQTRDIGYLVLPAERFTDVTVDDEAVESFYQENAAQFVTPEQVRAAYLELDLKAMADDVEVEEETLLSRYEAQQQNYRTPEERSARHILIPVPSDADPAAEQAAREQAEALLAQLRSEDADFAALAKEHSADPGSAAQGGDLGYFGRGIMDPAFEAATFALQPGEVSEPVRSAFGYHLIKLEAVRGGEVKPFEEVRDQIRRDIQRERAEESFYAQAEQLANLTYEHPDTLEVAAEQLGLSVQQTDLFPRNGGKQPPASSPKFAQAAFSEEVLAQGLNSEVIELGPDRLVVLRIAEHQPEQKKPLEAVRDSIVENLTQRKRAQLAIEQADAIVERLKAGEEAKSVAAETDLEWHEIEGLERTAQEPLPAVVEAAFRLPRPAGDQPSVSRVGLASGDQAVLALSAVNPGEMEQAPADAVERADATVRQVNAEATFIGVMNAIRARADIDL